MKRIAAILGAALVLGMTLITTGCGASFSYSFSVRQRSHY